MSVFIGIIVSFDEDGGSYSIFSVCLPKSLSISAGLMSKVPEYAWVKFLESLLCLNLTLT